MTRARAWFAAALIAVVPPGAAAGEDAVAALAAAHPGEARWLQGGEQRFLVLERGASGEPRGAVVLLHGLGGHADWPDVVRPLREGLAEHGWRTLSVQLPDRGDLPSDAAHAAALARVSSALGAAAGEGDRALVLAGYGYGASLALDYAAREAGAGLAAVVAVSPGAHAPDGEALASIAVPVLEVFGALEGERARAIAERHLRARRGKALAALRVVRMEAADRTFAGAQTRLVRLVRGWLSRLAAGS